MARDAKSSSWTLNSLVSRFLRYATISLPLKKIVSLAVLAWTAKTEDDEAMVESKTMITLEKVALVIDNGDTTFLSHQRNFIESLFTYESFCLRRKTVSKDPLMQAAVP